MGRGAHCLAAHLANAPPARVCRLMARIEVGQNRDLGRAREWLAKAAPGRARSGLGCARWHGFSGMAGGVAENPARLARSNGRRLLGRPAAGCRQHGRPARTRCSVRGRRGGIRRSGRLWSGGNGAGDHSSSEAGTKRRIWPGPKAAGARGRGDGRRGGGVATGKLRGEAAPASAIQIVPKAGAGALKPEIRKPNIFVPGPAPDDPGPRLPENDEAGTPLSRFRRPI